MERNRYEFRPFPGLPQMRSLRRVMRLAIACLCIAGPTQARDELNQVATWDLATWESAQSQFEAWITSSDMVLSDAERQQINAIWNRLAEPDEIDLVGRTIDALAVVNQDVAQLSDYLRQRSSMLTRPELDWMDDPTIASFVRSNARLLLGRHFAIRQMYDEALDELEGLDVDEVVDPAALLFYEAAARYRLRQREPGIAALEKLLENESILPRRFATVAELMLADLKSLQPDTLGEIARIMDSVRVRLELGRAGRRVRDEEDEVVKKLDKLIEQAESEQQKMMQAAAAAQGGGSSKSSNPASDSFLPQMQASGDVDPKDLSDVTDWGNVPPKQRQEILQSLSKEFPSHYREVVEEYLRTLARQDERSE